MTNSKTGAMYQAHTTYSISSISGEPHLVQRLQELGFSQGSNLTYIGHIAMGGPKIFQFGATLIALRDEESSCLELQKI